MQESKVIWMDSSVVHINFAETIYFALVIVAISKANTEIGGKNYNFLDQYSNQFFFIFQVQNEASEFGELQG